MTANGSGNAGSGFVRSFFRKTYRRIALIVWIILPAPLFSQSPPSNETILREKLLAPVLEEVVLRVPARGKVAFQTKIKAGLAEWLVRNLSDSCLSRNYLVYSPPPQDSGKVYRVELSDVNIKLIYRARGGRLGIWGGGWERRINMSLHLAITKPDGQMLVSRNVAGTWQDRIQSKDISQIENPNLPFTVGTKSDSRFIKRWLEPVLVTGATATVVYLFFSLRSDR